MVDTPKKSLIKETTLELAHLFNDLQLQDIVALDISTQCSWCDAIIVATYTSENQAKAVLQEAKNTLYQHDFSIQPHSKVPQSRWFLLDAYDIVIHLLSSDERAFYRVEEMWQQGVRLYPQENHIEN
ncbi:ribosome silencing factor [Entomospira entomophila]|uniref:Ribosome silencing factor n=1 Tax=Entomospira entomophila TaxID=2719988 RepID=A0A968GAJ0_9SPIO|nr:ribosome silencing factor [Entomospira entomophilus]NIZ40103.1 ribosome silencing factor [Entomospira entomophilus]WDI35663.1 ribosome silencing factor [Entomospira entomophilus]